MVRLGCWNIRGLNWPNKQDDIKIFLQLNNVGLVGFLETKIKEKNVDKVPNRMIPGWNWIHNFKHNPKGRIWIAWKPSLFIVHVLSMSAQHVYCRVCQQNDIQDFYMTYVYGEKHEGLRASLWQTLRDIEATMDEAWCVLGDFNSVLYKGDRIEGKAIQDDEIHHFSECIINCGLHELKYKGPYFS